MGLEWVLGFSKRYFLLPASDYFLVKNKTMSYLADVVVVGGKGGDAFDFKGIENGTTLKKISVWVSKKKVKGIKVWLTDEQCRLFGKAAKNVTDFTFEDGEHFSSLNLWDSGDGKHLGAIQFKTNHSREFFACVTKSNLKTEISVDVASGFCIGIKGCSELSRRSSGINSLGFMFLNPIKFTELTNVEYPTLHHEIPKVAVSEIKSMTYHNNTTETQEYRLETSRKITQTCFWSVIGTQKFRFGLKVNAIIPQLVECTARFELKTGVEGTYASETIEEKMELFSFPVKVPPGKAVDVNITIGQATIDLPFNGIVKITCHNDSVLQFKTSGTFKGVIYSDGKVAVNELA
ncbi:hypothetical protein AMELA_G00021700 [Ameiurus melas]|uniref:Jacalin-type lectin domain-containing protein n=1 Tax=Ameiurus melas TaxID=219545 RepID=A0A7J6BDP0_AMEME|nr:hypothetical protein AMELA_G00021700 [Ameiurus melas]